MLCIILCSQYSKERGKVDAVSMWWLLDVLIGERIDADAASFYKHLSGSATPVNHE